MIVSVATLPGIENGIYLDSDVSSDARYTTGWLHIPPGTYKVMCVTNFCTTTPRSPSNALSRNEAATSSHAPR
jgi:hypothetical protein